MKVALPLFVAGVSGSALELDTATPISKVLVTLSGCEAKVIKEGEEAQKVYAEFAEWCEDRSKNLGFEIKTGKGQAEGLQATIDKETANQQMLSSKIEDLAGDIATDEKDLAAATKIRNQERADFQTGEKDLVDVIDSLDRAMAVIEREMNKGGASMMQLKTANSLTQVFNVMVQASTLRTADAQKLTAFVQSSNDDDELEAGAPAGAVYSSQSGGIVDVLQGLHDQASEQLDKMRKQESTALFNYKKLKQSLDDAIRYANEELDESKKGLAASQEAQAAANGDLAVTKQDLAQDSSVLSDVHRTCMTTAQDFETETKSRSAELKGISQAKDAIAQIGVRQNSLLQISSSEDPSRHAVRAVRDLARQRKDANLAQLASRMSSTVTMDSKAGFDPFAKIKEMLLDDIAQLEQEAAEDQTQKAYCDKELAETREKIASNNAEVEKHSTKLAQRNSNSKKTKEQVATLQEEVATMVKEKLEMDNLRAKEKADYEFNKEETTLNLEGVKFALKVLRDFYGTYVKEHSGFSSTDGHASGVIAMIETVESDFSMQLAELNSVEEAAVREYDEMSKEFTFSKIDKEKAIKYKTRAAAQLDKYAVEHTTDLEGVQSELDANNEALSKLQAMCIGKAETYDERVARRQEEIDGLHNTLEALEAEQAASAEGEPVAAEAAEPAATAAAEPAATEASFVQVKHIRGGVRTRRA